MYSVQNSLSKAEFPPTVVLLVSFEGVVSVVTQCCCCVSLVKHCVTALSVTLLREQCNAILFSVDL